MTSICARPEITDIKIDKDNDIIPITVGLYKFFLAGGTAGIEAKTLYEHLIFTARLQETQTVHANNAYLGKGLMWGVAKVKKTKAWLAEAGLIEYIQYRLGSGLLSPVYIKIKFLLTRETLNARMGGFEYVDPNEVAADEVDVQMDLFDSLSDDEGDSTGGSEIEPPVHIAPVKALEKGDSTAGSFTAPPVNRTTGAEQQMLKVNNEMLEVKKGNVSLGETATFSESETERATVHTALPKKWRYNPNQGTAHIAEQVGRDIFSAWYSTFAQKTARLQNPSPADVASAVSLTYQFPDLCGPSGAEIIGDAVHRHFENWQNAWYLVSTQSRKLPLDSQKPYWNFRNFCAHFAEIRDLEPFDASQKTKPSGASGSGSVRRSGGSRGRVEADLSKYEHLFAKYRKPADGGEA